MRTTVEHDDRLYVVDLAQPLDISFPLIPGASTPKCFWAPDVSADPVREGEFVGSIALGGSVNFYNIHLNPHGNGTHTECVGHIADTQYSIQDSLSKYHFIAKLVTITPKVLDNGDSVITADQMRTALLDDIKYEAIILRTLPNDISDKKIDYSNSNPSYLDAEGIKYIHERGIDHLLLDLPSVDKEEDGGRLSAHKTFWNYPSDPYMHKTITEMIYVPNSIMDGLYMLELQVAPLVLDASPSRPVLYRINQK